MRKSLRKLVIPPAVCVCLLSTLNPAMAEESNAVPVEEVAVHSTSLTDYLVTTEVITAAKIKELGATNLAEAIARVPGLYVARADKGSRLLRIRGAATDQTKIYMDGMPVFPLSGIASNSASNLETIPVDNIEKIEIIKGPGPVQYGTDYKGGIILITTKDGKGPGQFNLNLSTGSHNSFDRSVSYSGADSNSGYYINAGKKQGDGHLNNSEFDTDYFNGKIKWNLGKDSSLTLNGYYMNTDREIPNSIDQLTGKETTTANTWSGDTGKITKDWKYTDFKQTSIGLQFDQEISSQFKYNVKFYHVTDGNKLWVYNKTNADNNINTSTNPIWYRSTWNSTGNGVEVTGDLQTDRNNTVTFGAKYNQIDWDSNDVLKVVDGGTDKRTGYYIQDNMKLSDKTNLTLGVRRDQAKQSFMSYNDAESDATDPVFNMTHQLDDQNTLRFSAGKSHNFVTAKQAATNLKLIASGSDVDIPDPEKATNYEVGWAHNFDNKSSLDIAAFSNKIVDRIERRSSGLKEYYNISKTDIQGVEVQYNQEITKRLKGFVNYTYQDAKDTSATGVKTDATNIPESIFNYGLTYTVDKFQASIFGQALGRIQTDNTTYKQLAGYHTLDLDLKYRENKNLEYYLRINNLLDADYWEKYDYPADGINFMTGVTMKL